MTDHDLAHATFYLSGDTLTPGFWTQYFGVEPKIAIVKGEPFTTPSGRPSRAPSRVGLWGLGSKGAVRGELLEPHLRFLIDHLKLPRSDLRALLAENGIEARFFCYWDNESGNRVPDVPDDIRAMMEAMGGTIEIDEYR
ncbi:hypothetical protein AWB75_02619 [Caballeronia catudaia]|uniref:DUF4279 domain-containing protein n=1 Tax=Caballeronia catudaia TaxID=1777136 RepID=A0A158AUF7_9BURK|nr:DUF4279 domain-containing protein [Caballeronia catudaia]SAK61373.1 hypothetical protein AWB75_02619 [Caballeronia catudaia]